MSKNVLYIEDEPFLGKIVKETLEKNDFRVLHIPDGAKVMQSFEIFEPDICVLDIMLPNVDGYDLCKQIKVKKAELPIIFLTAKVETEDLIKGFDCGADDYVRKPFSMEELIVRINHQLKTAEKSKPLIKDEIIKVGKYKFINDRYELHSPTRVIKLSQRDMEILRIFIASQNHSIDRKELLMSVWGDDSFFNSRNLDVYIRKIREYFAEDQSIEIVTLKGKGYLFLVP